MQIRFKHLVEDRDRHGNIRVYVRVPGRPKVRIRAPFGTDEFIAAYNAAVSDHVTAPPQARAAKAGSFRHPCVLYYASATFKRLDTATQSWRRRALDSMCENHADKPVARIEARHVRALRDERSDQPGAANTRLKALKALFAWALRGEAGTRSSKAKPERAEDQVRDGRPPLVDFRGDQAVSRSASDRQQGALGARSSALHWRPSRRRPRLGRNTFAMDEFNSVKPKTTTAIRSISTSLHIHNCSPASRRRHRAT